MIVTRTIRKTVITPVEISKTERYKPVDIRIPSNATRLTGVLVTTSATGGNVGTVTLQAGDSTDIFHVAPVSGYGLDQTDEAMMKFSNDTVNKPWVTGHVPELTPIDVAGDNVFIRAWFKGAAFQQPFTISIYVQYESAEEVIGIEPDRQQEEEKPEAIIL